MNVRVAVADHDCCGWVEATRLNQVPDDIDFVGQPTIALGTTYAVYKSAEPEMLNDRNGNAFQLRCGKQESGRGDEVGERVMDARIALRVGEAHRGVVLPIRGNATRKHGVVFGPEQAGQNIAQRRPERPLQIVIGINFRPALALGVVEARDDGGPGIDQRAIEIEDDGRTRVHFAR